MLRVTTLIGLALFLVIGFAAVCIGLVLGYFIGYRAAARKHQQGFPVQPIEQKPG